MRQFMLSTFVDTMAQQDVCLCVHATHDVRTMCKRLHINALAAVKLLLVVVWKLSDDGC